MHVRCAPEKEMNLANYLFSEQLPGHITDVKVVHCIDPAPYTRAQNYLIKSTSRKFKKLPDEHFQVLEGHLIDPVHKGPTRTSIENDVHVRLIVMLSH